MKNPLIIALDVDSTTQARDLIGKIGPGCSFYKIGMELYCAAGVDFVREVLDSGKQVFLDLKLYDIGETVKRAVAQVAKLNVTFLTVHGSQTVLKAAVEGKGSSALKLLGVTVLTSFDEQDLLDLGYACSPSDLVRLRARNAQACGVDGLICSALETASLREVCGPEMLLVVPGVRSATADKGDQKRVAAPADAMAAGADYLVIGRQVTRAPDPRAEIQNILNELAASAL